MAVVSWREVVPRTLQHRFGEPPSATRKFIATLNGPTGTQEVINTVGIVHGSAHPEYPFLLCASGTVTESDPFHAEFEVQYEHPKSGVEGYDNDPLLRADVWSFSSSTGTLPTFVWNNAGTPSPLVNTAGELFEGVTQLVGELKASIQGNRAVFPIATAVAATGRVNGSAYLGGGIGTWLCEGIAAQQQVEVVNQVERKYWSVTANLHYRGTGHGVYLPNVGYNQLISGELKPCTVTHQGDAIPVTKPVALDANGRQLPPGTMPTVGYFETHNYADFNTLFGSPP